MLFFAFFHIRCCARYITLREVNRYWIELIGLFGSDYNGRDGRERERENQTCGIKETEIIQIETWCSRWRPACIVMSHLGLENAG